METENKENNETVELNTQEECNDVQEKLDQMTEMDECVAAIINDKVKRFELGMKDYLKSLGYESTIKVQVAFGSSE